MTQEDLYLIKNAIQTLKENSGFDEIKFETTVAFVRLYWFIEENQNSIIRIDLNPKF